MTRSAWIFTLAALAFGSVTIVPAGDFRMPGNQRGFTPEQPLAYSHQLHAGELGMDCQFCHYGASRSRHAGIPPTDLCMNCHLHVTASFDAMLEERQAAEAEGREARTVVSQELAKLYAALGLDEDRNPLPGVTPPGVDWLRVNKLPDFVYFDHRPHVARGINCQTCHGPVQSMERVRQEFSLSMGWCLDCHRTTPAEADESLPFDVTESLRDRSHVSTDCSICHM